MLFECSLYCVQNLTYVFSRLGRMHIDHPGASDRILREQTKRSLVSSAGLCGHRLPGV